MGKRTPLSTPHSLRRFVPQIWTRVDATVYPVLMYETVKHAYSCQLVFCLCTFARYVCAHRPKLYASNQIHKILFILDLLMHPHLRFPVSNWTNVSTVLIPTVHSPVSWWRLRQKGMGSNSLSGCVTHFVWALRSLNATHCDCFVKLNPPNFLTYLLSLLSTEDDTLAH